MSDMDVMDDSGSGGDAPVVPSVADLITASIREPQSRDTDTALDDLHIRFVGETSETLADMPDIRIEEKRPRGRPRKTDAPIAPERVPAKRKSDLAADVVRLESALAAEQSRNDASKISELSKSIEMACYLAFGYASETRGKHWEIGEKEAHEIGDAGAHALAPYATQIAGQLPWILFAGVVGKAVYSRVQIDRQILANYRTLDTPK